MPRYFFNFHGQSSATPDLIGRTFPDDESAKAEAESIGREVTSLGVFSGTLINDCWIEVVDEGQRPIALLPLQETTSEGPNRVE